MDDPPGYNEDEDSDFEPDATELAECTKSAPAQACTTNTGPSKKSRIKTDALWASMNERAGTMAANSQGKAKASSKPLSWRQLQKKMKSKKKRPVANWKNLLKKPKRRRTDVSAAAVKAAKNVLSNSTEMSVVKFAGKEMRLKKSKAAPGHAVKTKPSNALDSILEAIKDPKNINTVEKSSYDWDQYKEEHKLDADFDKQAQNGFVQKKEFLNRVDWRRYESEKSVRDVERTKRQTAPKA